MLKGLTVQYLFRQTHKLKAGDTILFHAAAGGVGLIACQWARALGVTMIGTVGSDEKAALAKANGCTHTIVYTRENFVERVKALTGGKGVPVVYDGVGKDTFPASLDCLSPRGLLVSFGNSSGAVPAFDILLLSQKGSLYATRPTLATLCGEARGPDGDGGRAVRARPVPARSSASRARPSRSRMPLRRIAHWSRARRPARRCCCPRPVMMPAFGGWPTDQRTASLSSVRAAGMSSLAVRPSGPAPAATQASAAAPCRHTADAQCGLRRRSPARATRATNPARTSPVPAVASAGIAGCVDVPAAVRMRQHAARALDDDRRVERRRKRLRGAEPIGLNLDDGHAEQARRLGGMRRDDRRRGACLRPPARAPRQPRSRLSASASSTSGDGFRDGARNERFRQQRRCRVRAADERVGAGAEHLRPPCAASIPAASQSTAGNSAAANPIQTLPAPVLSAARPASSGAPIMPARAADDAERAERSLVHVARAPAQHVGQAPARRASHSRRCPRAAASTSGSSAERMHGNAAAADRRRRRSAARASAR